MYGHVGRLTALSGGFRPEQSREGGFNCFCDGTQRNKKTVGREPRGGQGRPAATVNLPGKGWYQPPPQCASGFEPTCLKKSSGWGGRCEAYGGCLTGHSDAADTVCREYVSKMRLDLSEHF